MSDRPVDLVELYRAKHLPEAHAIRIALESEGIRCVIDNELLQGAVGELPLGWATAPRILVTSDVELAAKTVLNDYLQAEDSADAVTPDAASTVCLACGAPMGDVCSRCGWTFRNPEPSDEEEEPASDDGVAPTSPVEVRIPTASPQAWWEVGAVLAVGVIPNLLSAISSLAHPQPPLPYWLDSFNLIVMSLCTIFVTLYIIYRSELTWSDFGLVRPHLSDVFLGIVLYFVAVVVSLGSAKFQIDTSLGSETLFPRPRSVLDHVLMVLKYLANAGSEELVVRAYLITRLESLLRSKGEAVAFAALAFACYHIYWGIDGVLFALLFGLGYGFLFVFIRRVWPFVIGHATYNILNELGAG